MLIRTTVHPDARELVDGAADFLAPVQHYLARIREGSNFPALSRQIIDTITALDDDGQSLQRLANVVLREYSLTLSVIRTANSVHYRRSARPIQSATHAMLLLGAKTVRQLASSLLLFENYQRQSPGLKELMLLSLLTANHAREIALRLGLGVPEEAHLCGMFRNLGEVLIACHFPHDYARIHTMMFEERKSDHAAAFNVLGFRYEELGELVARFWGMPESVLIGMRAQAAAMHADESAVTSFSHELTNVIYRRDLDERDAQRGVDELMARYRVRLKLTREQVRDIVDAALSETRELFVNARVAIGALRMRQLSNAARCAMGVAPLESGEWRAVEAATPAVLGTQQLRERLQQELEGRINPQFERELGPVLLLALEGALRGAPFDRVIACVVSADRTRLFARSGFGLDVESLITRFDFPLATDGGPVASAVLGHHTLYLPLDRAMTDVEVRWAASFGVAQFGVFPIAVDGDVVGCLYGDRVCSQPMLDLDARRFVETMTSLVVDAIVARRNP